MKSLGDRIKYYRNLNGWNQDEMAEKLEISLPAYSKIERNITDVSYSRLVQLAKIFKISVADLVSLNIDPSKKVDLEQALAEKDAEINRLQKRIIELLEGKK